ncbi:hypothetical protein BAY61_25925 [Prauserella marina]|uniref:Uncharacterized protein n=1 Tax=Prauserella marina TaxID=530584 RepID=A0A222VVE7_9PSEU|nr:hypothetical protein [Prauserella marina]ASR37875.1 hypothetical protein BAY61_25925 [Prauserella marina]PWV73075.1 hypothetical protein DES30_10924 [Prauserella marina]SDD72495.1 hypothetical protein SAMN05421630_111249 [Prauserella marina]
MATSTGSRPRIRVGRRTRKWLLFTHIVASVGWLGIEACLLTLGILGVSSDNPGVVTSSYVIAGELGGVFYLPASVLTALSGIALSLCTPWGLLRHYWVIAKIVMTIPLLVAGNLVVVPEFVEAGKAVAGGATPGDVQRLLITAMLAGLVLLAVSTLLSVFTPGGRTKLHPARSAAK